MKSPEDLVIKSTFNLFTQLFVLVRLSTFPVIVELALTFHILVSHQSTHFHHVTK